MQRNFKLSASPSTGTFIIEDNQVFGRKEKSKVETARKSTQSLHYPGSGIPKKHGGMRTGQKGGASGVKRSEANFRQSGITNREPESMGKRRGRTESQAKAFANASETRTFNAGVTSNDEWGGSHANEVRRKGEAVSMGIHVPREKSFIYGAKPKKWEIAAASEVTRPNTATRKEILETASSFRLSRPCPTNWEVNSDVSSSTFVVEPAKPIEVNPRKRGKGNCVEDTPDRAEKKEKSDGMINRRGGKRMKSEKGMRKPRMASFKIYKRCIPRSLCRRWRHHNSSGELTDGETVSFPAASRRTRLPSDRISEPWMRKEFVWKSRKEAGKSALSVNSSLCHINYDDAEDFACWERVPTAAITCTWETFLYKWRKSWSVLSLAAFRKNRLSDTPGEILQILKDGNSFTKRRSSRDHAVPERPPEVLVPSSPFDVEPSIFQKNIDIRDWVEALRFYSIRPEEERGAVQTTEEMTSKSDPIEFHWRKIDAIAEGSAISALLAFLLGLFAVGYLISTDLSNS